MGKGEGKKKSAAAAPVAWDYAPFLLVLVLLAYWVAFVVMGTFRPLTQEMAGVDPVGYYAWSHSLLFDHDLNFENEYRAFNSHGAIAGDTLVDPDGERTPTGLMQNAFSIGPGLLWMPFLLVGHVVAGAGGWETDGFSQPYISAVVYANMIYGWVGLLLLYGFLRGQFSKRVSFLAATTAFVCSTILYYTYAQETVSHATSFFSVALLLYVWQRYREKEALWGWVLIGACVGLTTLIRWQNITFAAVVAVDLLWANQVKNIPKMAASGAASAVVFVPQLISWKVLYGSFFTIPQGGGFMDWGHPNPFKMLFSLEYGLITWTPLMAVGIAGLCWMPREHRRFYACLIAALALQLYIQSVAGNVGWSFGMRRLTNCVPLFAVGFALLLARYDWKSRYVLCVVAPFALWNFLSAIQYGGILDPYYVDRAITQLCAEHQLDRSALQGLTQLPDGEPFNLLQFADAHRFPRDRAPSVTQLTLDKFQVLQAAGTRLLLVGTSPE